MDLSLLSVSLKAPISFSFIPKFDDNFNSLFLPPTSQAHDPSTCLDPISSQLLITLAPNSPFLLYSSLIYFPLRIQLSCVKACQLLFFAKSHYCVLSALSAACSSVTNLLSQSSLRGSLGDTRTISVLPCLYKVVLRFPVLTQRPVKHSHHSLSLNPYGSSLIPSNLNLN